MVALCSCRLHWIISIKKDLSKPYECPICEAKRKNTQRKMSKPKKKNKNEGRVSSVLQRNREKHSISNS